MGRKAKRLLQKKLGDDFPLDQYLAVLGASGLSPADLQIFILKKYIPVEFNELGLEVDINEEFNSQDSLNSNSFLHDSYY